MKIAQVSPYFYPHIGGVESHVLTLSLKLKKLGHDVTVFTSRYKGTSENDTFKGIRIVRAKELANIFFTPVTPQLKRMIPAGEYDVIHAHTPPPLSSYYALKAAKRAKTPYVLTYHCDLELPHLLGKVAASVYRRTIARYTIRRANRIIVHTKTYGATSRAIWEANPAVVPSAVNPDRFTGDVDSTPIRKRHDLEGKKVVLFVGRLVFHKGLDYLVDAAEHTEPYVQYVLVGTGEYMEKLKKRIKEKKLDNRFVLAGNVSFEDLPLYFAACDVLVLPSISRLEAFGLVVLEAMASKKPVIVSRIPGVEELVEEGKNGLHAEPMNSSDLAEKLKTILSDEDLRMRMGEEGRRMVLSDYNWDTVAHKIEEVYKEAKGV